MAVAVKDFVVRYGLQVNSGVIYANSTTNSVGINTLSPDANLTVNGTIHAVGNAWFDSTVNVASSVTVGNSSANTQANSTAVSTGSGQFSTSVGVGSNVLLSTSSLSIGNSSANTQANSTTVTTQAANLTSNLSVAGVVSFSSTGMEIGANVSFSTSLLSIGNSSVNTQINSSFATFPAGNVTGSWTVSGNLVVNGNTVFIGTQIANGNFLPYANGYSLGNTTSVWNLFGNSATLTTGLTVGSSTVNTGTVSTGNVQATNSVSVGSNVLLSASVLSIGNSSANTQANSTAITVGTLSVSNGANFSNTSVSGARMKAYKEYVNSIGSVTASTLTIDTSTANIHDVTLANNITVSFSNLPASGNSYYATLVLRQDATGSRTLTWPAAMKWPNGSAPTLTATASAVDVVAFFTVDGGTTLFGSVVMLNLK
jgi:acyl-CoA hydrolase